MIRSLFNKNVRFRKPLQVVVPFPKVHDIQVKQDNDWITIIFKFKTREIDEIDTVYLKAKLLMHGIMRFGEYSTSTLYDKDLEYDLQIMFILPRLLNP